MISFMLCFFFHNFQKVNVIILVTRSVNLVTYINLRKDGKHSGHFKWANLLTYIGSTVDFREACMSSTVKKK